MYSKLTINSDLTKLTKKIDGLKDEMIQTLSNLIRIKALAPENGGDGEIEKAEYIQTVLSEFDIKRYDSKDDRVSSGIRPNLVVKLKGESKRRLWIVTHMDVVPEGDLSLWKTPPFEPVIKNGKIYGRGSEDNGQSIVASIFALKAISELNLTPKYTFCLAFVSDEEVGSKHGILHLLNSGVFRNDDLILVPDAGTSKGDKIEIAEKSILWLKFTVLGKQGHASRPDKSLNAFRTAIKFLLELDEILHKTFNARDDLFNPPYSTFEPTKREKNVNNINTIPGVDISYMDCRILPNYKIDDVIKVVNDVASKYKCVKVDIIQRHESPPTSENSKIVVILKRALKDLRNINAKVYGIGGNTCAAFFRKAGIDTAVWSTIDGTAHQPNEYAVINNMIEDSKIFAVLPFYE